MAAYCSTTVLSHGLGIDWHQPDGFRLTNDQAAELAAKLQAAIDSGDTAEYERKREIAIGRLRNNDCDVYVHEYCIFSADIVAEFAGFLRDCGGCSISCYNRARR